MNFSYNHLCTQIRHLCKQRLIVCTNLVSLVGFHPVQATPNTKFRSQFLWKHAHEVLYTELSQLRDQRSVSSTDNVLFTLLWTLVRTHTCTWPVSHHLRALSPTGTAPVALPCSPSEDTLEALCGTLVWVPTPLSAPVLLWLVETDLWWADDAWDGAGSSLESISWAPPPSVVTQLLQMSFSS